MQTPSCQSPDVTMAKQKILIGGHSWSCTYKGGAFALRILGLAANADPSQLAVGAHQLLAAYMKSAGMCCATKFLKWNSLVQLIGAGLLPAPISKLALRRGTFKASNCSTAAAFSPAPHLISHMTSEVGHMGASQGEIVTYALGPLDVCRLQVPHPYIQSKDGEPVTFQMLFLLPLPSASASRTRVQGTCSPTSSAKPQALYPGIKYYYKNLTLAPYLPLPMDTPTSMGRRGLPYALASSSPVLPILNWQQLSRFLGRKRPFLSPAPSSWGWGQGLKLGSSVCKTC